jgi:hypothetical protein
VHVVGKDQLKNIVVAPRQIIVSNFHNSFQQGTHWVGIVTKEPKYSVYFDSFGLDAPEEVLSVMRKYKKSGIVRQMVASTRKIQPMEKKPGSDSCGWYILKFLDFYILKNCELLDSILNVNVKNTLKYGKLLTKKYLS